MAITNQTFPGYYPTVIDNSLAAATTSNFSAVLLGVATKGPFNTATSVLSLSDYAQKFGAEVSTSQLATVAGLLTTITDGISIVRVGAQYSNVSTGASGQAGLYTLYTPNASYFSPNQYVRVTQPGLPSTVNGVIASTGTNSITLVSAGAQAQALNASYTGATIDVSNVSGAANEAESFLQSYSYTLVAGVSAVVGTKNGYSFQATGAATYLSAGQLIKISQSGKATTREVLISSVRADGTVFLQTTNISQSGYQALPLQDNYTAGQVYVTAGYSSAATSMSLLASEAGTWANSAGTSGLSVTVSPGSTPDSKLFQVSWNGAIVENIDQLTFNDATDPNYVVTRINGLSDYIIVNPLSTNIEPPANTTNPWDLTDYNVLNVAEFSLGFDGTAVVASDFVGTIDASGSPTGLQVVAQQFNTQQSPVNTFFICAPGISDISVAQEMALIGSKINAVGLMDIPAGLNLRAATDWTNGAGLYESNGRIDSPYIAFFWNWGTAASPFTGNSVVVPPTHAALRALSYTFDTYKPWYAAAGDIQGLVPEWTSVAYKYVSDTDLQASYGAGNCVNSILLINGNVEVFGDRTAKRDSATTTDKLTALHSVTLVNYIVSGLGQIGHKYIFQPNDQILLSQINLDYTTFLNAIRNARGIETYDLICDSSNNTATTRNQREVIVDLSFTPEDALERLYLNATVNSSGATVNAVQ